ncbi:MAG: pyridoxal phosphate-dependent aminotransferase [Sphingomonadales bacterium]|nr:pyridoxal phosphate-dependent aminotransferase [Sphingomonadales bacterium]
MPKISQRGHSMPASPIRRLVPFAEAAKQNGTTVFHLNIGQPDIATAPAFWEGVASHKDKVLPYSHSAGLVQYRQAYADQLNRKGYGLTAEDVLISIGGSEALVMTMMACFDSGDEVLIPEPFYANYNGFAAMGGVLVRPFTTTIEEQFALPELDAVEAAIGPRTKALMICNPNNPTGTLYSKSELEALAEICLRHDLFLIADEVYREFVYDGREHFSILGLNGLEQHAVVVESTSKIYSACGARIGALITKNTELMATALKYAQARLSPPTLEQMGAMSALLHTGSSYFDEVRAEYVSRRNLMVQALNAMPGVTCPLPGGAFYAVARLPIADSDDFCHWMLEHHRHDGATIMMAPATGFYATPRLGSDEVRLAYVLEKANLTRAMECLATGLVAYNS